MKSHIDRIPYMDEVSSYRTGYADSTMGQKEHGTWSSRHGLLTWPFCLCVILDILTDFLEFVHKIRINCSHPLSFPH